MEKFILQKFISNSGHCSRRQAEELIRLGEVIVNGKIAELGQKVFDGDAVEIDGKKIIMNVEKIYIALNKPVGYTCTNRKFKNEKNVFELLPDEFQNFHVVGRLDKNSRGLVLLTNDGNFTLQMTHPRFEHEKKYVIEIKKLGNWEIGKLVKILKRGVDIGEGEGIVRVKDIKYLENNKFEIVLTEGRKRQIRRMFKTLELEVLDLQRVAIGKVLLGDLKEGQWEKVDKISVG